MPRRTVIIISSVVAALLIVGAGILVLVRRGAPAPAVVPSGSSASRGTEAAPAAGEAAPAPAASCEELDGADRDACLRVRAVAAANADDCAGIQTAAVRATCEDEIALAAAVAGKDAQACTALAEPRRGECYNDVFGQLASADDCAGAGDLADICRGVLAPKMPPEESGARKIDPAADDDHDGLTNAQERQYGSDPTNPDTDADGFSDGAEVKGGYSPVGPGKLSANP